MQRTAVIWLLASTALACAATDAPPDPTAECIATYARAKGFSLGDADGASVEAGCAARGDACPQAEFISQQAALCIAGVAGLEKGLDTQWSTSILYATGLKRVVWVVSNRLRDGKAPLGGGHLLHIDVRRGAVLAKAGWGSVSGW